MPDASSRRRRVGIVASLQLNRWSNGRTCRYCSRAQAGSHNISAAKDTSRWVPARGRMIQPIGIALGYSPAPAAGAAEPLLRSEHSLDDSCGK